jgi:hypothetical protein
MNCPTCKTEFTPRVGGKPQRHCSPACRKKAHRTATDSPEATSQRPDAVGHQSNVAASLDAKEAHSGRLPEGVGRRILLWVDDPVIGSGSRPFVVTGMDATRVKLFSCAALVEIDVSRRDFDKHAESYESDPATVLAILRRNVATCERHRLDHDRDAARFVERLLAESPDIVAAAMKLAA